MIREYTGDIESDALEWGNNNAPLKEKIRKSRFLSYLCPTRSRLTLSGR